mmetsp:Transcript_892/g.2322  ORF Transcript_892/g.2322 Transcript_892/m.2322 type:complete len:235 (+) Transcript_892:282-986(+)
MKSGRNDAADVLGYPKVRFGHFQKNKAWEENASAAPRPRGLSMCAARHKRRKKAFQRPFRPRLSTYAVAWRARQQSGRSLVGVGANRHSPGCRAPLRQAAFLVHPMAPTTGGEGAIEDLSFFAVFAPRGAVFWLFAVTLELHTLRSRSHVHAGRRCDALTRCCTLYRSAPTTYLEPSMLKRTTSHQPPRSNTSSGVPILQRSRSLGECGGGSGRTTFSSIVSSHIEPSSSWKAR